MTEAASVAGLSPEEKRALLKQLLAGTGDYPLSHGQRSLWFLQRLLPDTFAYNVVFAARLQPGLDLTAFRRALDRLVARHAALRTVFPAHDGQPVQRVRPPGPAPLRVVEMPGASDDEVLAALTADARRPFDLDVSPFAVTVYRRADEDALLLNVHHIVFDVWSLHVLLEDLRALYDGERRGVPATLPPIAARYTDFVAAQARMLDGARGETAWSYWARALAGALPPLELVAAAPRPPAVALRGTSIPFSLGPELSAAVYGLARARTTTLYVVVLAALQVALSSLGGQQEIVIGSPVALRSDERFARVVGYFVNPVPVRGQLRPEETFADLLVRVRDQVYGALDHQEFPFPLLVDRLQVRREPNRHPIFQVMLNLLVATRTGELSRLLTPGSRATLDFGGSRLTPYHLQQLEGQFELALELTDVDGTLEGRVQFQTDVYDAETARDVRDALRAVLAAATAHPEAPVAELLGRGQREDFEL